MTRRTTAYSRLRDMADTIHADCASCTTPQLRALVRQIDALTGTNCGWDVYRMRHVVRGIATDHLAMRRREARAAGGRASLAKRRTA